MGKSESNSTQTLLGLIGLVILLVAFLVGLNFLKSSPTAAWSAVGAITVGIISLVGTSINNRSAQSVQVRQEQITTKQEIYEEVNRFLMRLIYPGNEPEAPEDPKKFMQRITPRLSLYASGEVLSKFRDFMQSAFSGQGGMVLVGLYEELIFCMRHDLGHDTKHTQGDILGLFITDLDNCLSMIEQQKQGLITDDILQSITNGEVA